MTTVADLLLGETCRQLSGLEAALNSTRSNAGLLLTGASVVSVAFLSVAAVEKTRSDASILAEVVALVLFGLLVIGCAYILRPRDWTNDADLTDWMGIIDAGELIDPADMAVELSRFYLSSHETNTPTLKQLQSVLTASCVLLGLQVIAWAFAVA
jgi:hypothetical protein